MSRHKRTKPDLVNQPQQTTNNQHSDDTNQQTENQKTATQSPTATLQDADNPNSAKQVFIQIAVVNAVVEDTISPVATKQRANSYLRNWSGRKDSNLRPPAPHAGALPDCATPREPISISPAALSIKVIDFFFPSYATIYSS
jgi:hypothetical protein